MLSIRCHSDLLTPTSWLAKKEKRLGVMSKPLAPHPEPSVEGQASATTTVVVLPFAVTTRDLPHQYETWPRSPYLGGAWGKRGVGASMMVGGEVERFEE